MYQTLTETNVKSAETKYDLALEVMEDIKTFRKKKNNCTRVVMAWVRINRKYIEAKAHSCYC